MTGRDVLTVIFDLDGTLVDTAEDVRDMINPLFDAIGRTRLTREDAAACFGLGAVRFVERALARTEGPTLSAAQQQSLTDQFLRIYATAPPVHSHALPGVPLALATCRAAGWRMGVCTNKPYAAARIVLDFLDLTRWFDGISGGDSAVARKPDPVHLRDAVARAGGSIARAVMVGDSETDAQCAQAAGMPVVLIAGGYTHAALHSLGANRVLDGFAGLPAAITALDPGPG